MFDLVAVVSGCVLLYFGGEALLDGALRIGKSLKWSEAITGLVLVSLGTSAPELFVSVGSALQGFGDIAAGNVVGSNTVNIALVLGLGAVIFPLSVDSTLRTTQFPLMVFVSVLTVVFLSDGYFGRSEGATVFLLVLAGLAFTFYWPPPVREQTPQHVAGPADTPSVDPVTPLRHGVLLLLGIVGLVAGAELLIFGGVGLSRDLGISEAVIALTVTALGTSLPEIAATVIAVSRRQGQLAVGNVLGSNILNIGLVLGVAGMIAPITAGGVDQFSLLAMLAFSAVAMVLAFKPGFYPRWCGVLLLSGYVVYLFLLLR